MNPFELHPHLDLSKYRGSGWGGIDAGTGTTIGMVKVTSLADMPGNGIRSWDTVRNIAQDLESGVGLYHPISVVYHHDSHTATVDEGNHRLKAAMLAGHEYVPVEVHRQEYSPVTSDFKRGRVAKRIGPGGRGWPWVGGMGEIRVPSNIHPSWVFHPSEVYSEGW